jgi:hypothetical protein
MGLGVPDWTLQDTFLGNPDISSRHLYISFQSLVVGTDMHYRYSHNDHHISGISSCTLTDIILSIGIKFRVLRL